MAKRKGTKKKSVTKKRKKEPTRIIRKITAGPPGSTRREFQRIEGNVKVVYQLLDDKSLSPKEEWAPLGGVGVASEHVSTAKDLSAGGAMFFTDSQLPVKAMVGMRIEIPDGGGPVRCIAQIVRVEEIKKRTIYSTAVRFVDMVKSDRRRIQDFVDTEGVEYVLGSGQG
jgi:c-di-GMP-binding flagellar brake protein YcgR